MSFRCGKAILDKARLLIESMPGRSTRPTLAEGPSNPPGTFAYLRFEDNTAEVQGVARLVAHFRGKGVEAAKIAILTRSDFNGAWSKPVREALQAIGVPATDVEAALEPLFENNSRALLAVARLANNRADDLAWWTVLWATRGVSDDFMTLITNECIKTGDRFVSRVLTLESVPLKGASTTSNNAAVARVRRFFWRSMGSTSRRCLHLPTAGPSGFLGLRRA